MRDGWRVSALLAVVAAFFVSISPANAHHAKRVRPGEAVGVAIPAISHGEMPVFAKHLPDIMDLARRQPRTDATLRRLQGFVNLQTFACFWGLGPGALSDEGSPFNECAHGYLAGARALLTHMAEMPGDETEARALQRRIAEDLARDPALGAICSNSKEAFDSGIVVGPDWGLALTHMPTLATAAGILSAIAGGLALAMASLQRSASPRQAVADAPLQMRPETHGVAEPADSAQEHPVCGDRTIIIETVIGVHHHDRFRHFRSRTAPQECTLPLVTLTGDGHQSLGVSAQGDTTNLPIYALIISDDALRSLQREAGPRANIL